VLLSSGARRPIPGTERLSRQQQSASLQRSRTRFGKQVWAEADSGERHHRYATNRRLGAALHLQAFAALGASPGARAYYDALRRRDIGHHAALRQLANRLVSILHGYLKSGDVYDENVAWQHHQITTGTVAA